MNGVRVGAIARNVFWQVIRDRVLYLLGFYAGLLLLVSQIIPQVSAGADRKILLDVGLAAVDLFGLFIAVFVGAGLINQEIERRTILALIAKPMSRSEFIVGKHLGVSAVLALLVMLMSVLALLMFQITQVEYPLGSVAIAIGFIFLKLVVITAVSLFFGTLTSSLLAALLTFGVYLVGHLSKDLVALGQLTENPGLQQFTEGVFLILPNLSRLDLKNQAVYDLLPSSQVLFTDAVYGLLYTVLLLAIATMIFSRREF